MEIKQAEFVTSAVKKNQYPDTDMPEIAFVGRSNVGKSSLINTMVNRRKLVKVSSTPGKTRLVNFFIINNLVHFVDLPGYGYAKVSKSEQKTWAKVIETYLLDRVQLKKVVLLLDSRRKPNADDIMMYEWIKYYGYEAVIVMTKIDKLKKREYVKCEKLIRETIKLKDERIIKFSTLKKVGKEELIEEIFKGII